MLRNIVKLPQYILHKGYAKNYHENTIDSIIDAKRHCAQWVEIDVQVLKNGTAVIFHDDEWLGKNVSDYDTYDDFCAQVPNYHPPTLSQALQTCYELGLGVNLDLKDSVCGNEQIIIDIINKHLSHFTILLSSFNAKILSNCSRLSKSHLLMGILFDEIPPDWKTIAKTLNVDSIHTNYQYLSDSLITEIKKDGYPLIVYTINEKNICGDFFLAGVDTIITDEIF